MGPDYSFLTAFLRFLVPIPLTPTQHNILLEIRQSQEFQNHHSGLPHHSPTSSDFPTGLLYINQLKPRAPLKTLSRNAAGTREE